MEKIRYIGFQMIWKLSTLDDLEGHWQLVWLVTLGTAGLLVNINKHVYLQEMHTTQSHKNNVK